MDVEGKASGIEKELAEMLGSWGKIPVTYAGGVGSFDDLRDLKKLGQNHLDVTIGKALDLFARQIKLRKWLTASELLLQRCKNFIKNRKFLYSFL